jgi:hypothetical protein
MKANGYPLSCRIYKVDVYEIGIECPAITDEDNRAKSPFVVRLGSKLQGISPEAERTPSRMRRRRPECFDVSTLKFWINNCLMGHLDCHRGTLHLKRPLIRLIDVEENCLKTFEGGALQYIALSYVWGNCRKDHRLVRKNLASYHRSGGLKSLPRTIADTISVVHMLGQRYLWVDALCIVQDDPSDQAVQIPAMTTIYGDCLLTIVAAFGNDSEAGLPGVNAPRQQQITVDAGEFSLLRSVGRSYGNFLEETAWNTRGWTFQELMLCRCCVIFLEGQICYQCRTAAGAKILTMIVPP